VVLTEEERVRETAGLSTCAIVAPSTIPVEEAFPGNDLGMWPDEPTMLSRRGAGDFSGEGTLPISPISGRSNGAAGWAVWKTGACRWLDRGR
jgi:hypothetical protein